MRELIITTMAMGLLAVAPAFADGPGAPPTRPVVTEPAQPKGYFYAGLMGGAVSTTTKSGEYDVHECVADEGHFGKKCGVSQEDYDIGLADIEERAQPWKNDPDDPARYMAGVHPVLWMGDREAISFRSYGGEPSDYGHASNNFVETIEEFVTSKDFKFGGFAGYRYPVRNVVIGGEISALDGWAQGDLQLGLGSGNVLPYAFIGYADSNEGQGAVYGLGADITFRNRWIVGAKFATGDETGELATLRVGFRF